MLVASFWENKEIKKKKPHPVVAKNYGMKFDKMQNSTVPPELQPAPDKRPYCLLEPAVTGRARRGFAPALGGGIRPGQLQNRLHHVLF